MPPRPRRARMSEVVSAWLIPGTRDRACASLSAPTHTLTSSPARDSAGRAPAPARSSRCGNRRYRARPADTGRQSRHSGRLPIPARTPMNSRAESAAAAAVRSAVARPRPLCLRSSVAPRDRRRERPCDSRLSNASQYCLRFGFLAVEAREKFRIPFREFTVDLQAGVGPAADPLAVMQVRPRGLAVAHVRLVVAAAGTQRPRPADRTVGLVGDMVLLQECRLFVPIDAVGDGAEFVCVRPREAVAQRDIAV